MTQTRAQAGPNSDGLCPLACHPTRQPSSIASARPHRPALLHRLCPLATEVWHGGGGWKSLVGGVETQRRTSARPP
eukprot:439624-Prymnesium_polylepis.1